MTLKVGDLPKLLAEAMHVSDLVEKLRSVAEIYQSLIPSLRDKPFIVQRSGSESWHKDTFFVVRRVIRKGSSFSFFGDLYRRGQFIRSREGDVLPLSFAAQWVQLPYSTVVCVAVEAGICPKEECFCVRVDKCSILNEWISEVVRLSDKDDGFEEFE
jgi:hypothetical protein